MILQLSPTLPLDTPKGKATAHFVVDAGNEHYLQWVCFVDETGECWAFRNDVVRLQANETLRPRAEPDP